MNEEDFLEHYGVLGMKWGVRKDRRSQPRIEDPAKKKLVDLTSEVKKQAKRAKKFIVDPAKPKVMINPETTSGHNIYSVRRKVLDQMTDAELQKRVLRLNLERQYKNLRNPKYNKYVKKGEAFVEDFAEQTVQELVKIKTATG